MKKVTTDLTTNESTDDTYTYDAAGNITSCDENDTESAFVYGTGNRLTSYNGASVSYDLDGNMTSASFGGSAKTLVYDSGNRLTSCGGNIYTYNVEDVRVTNVRDNVVS